MKNAIYLTLVMILFVSCASSSTSVITSDSYNQDKNTTTLSIVPFGTIEIKGEWNKTKYNEVSRQHFFEDENSNSIAIALNPTNKYPFYKAGMTDGEFAKAFFQWEKEYYEKQGFKINELESEDQYVLWEAIGDNAHSNFLYGAKNGKAYNFAVFESKLGEEETKEFLVNLFEKN